MPKYLLQQKTKVTFLCRMRALEVRGKSTRGIRKVYVVIPEFLLPALNRLATPGKTFLFQRYEVLQLFIVVMVVLFKSMHSC